MAEFLHIQPGRADVYFEIAIPKMLHPDVREDLKTRALTVIRDIDPNNNRKWWFDKEYKAHDKPNPIEVRDHVRSILTKFPPEKCLDITTAGCDEDFYCWTGTNRICYHSFAVLDDDKSKDRLVVTSRHCGFDVTIDLHLIMAYATEVPDQSQERKQEVVEVT